VAKSLGYRSDPALSALVAYRGRVRKPDDYGTLALLSARGHDEKRLPEYFRLYIQGMRETAGELGYRLEIFEIFPDRNSHRQVSRILYSRGIRGVIIGPVPENWPHLDLQWKHFSAVTLGRSLLSPRLHRVTPNHYPTVEVIYQKLRELGYRKIGFCDRLGSEQNMHFMNLSVYLRCLYFDGGNSLTSPPYLFESKETLNPLPWLERHSFDALICGWSDSIRKLVEGSRFEVPKHLGLADISAHLEEPDYAGIVHNQRAIGSAAISLLHANLLRNHRGIPTQAQRQSITIDGAWRQGKTLRRQKVAAARSVPRRTAGN
jgi:DNA-binding LacI/PurR family transcriptional regulator